MLLWVSPVVKCHPARIWTTCGGIFFFVIVQVLDLTLEMVPGIMPDLKIFINLNFGVGLENGVLKDMNSFVLISVSF